MHNSFFSRHSLLFLVPVFLLSCAETDTKTPDAEDRHQEKPDAEFEAYVRGLIEQLAISQEPPHPTPVNPTLIPGHGETIPQSKLERAKRMRQADKAGYALLSEGLRVIPFLLEHVDDRRASGNFGRSVMCPTVGFVCTEIIKRLGTFSPERGRTCESGLYSLLHEDLLAEWWAERQDNTRKELKEESAIFALAMVRYHREIGTKSWVSGRSDLWEQVCHDKLKELGVTGYETRAAAILNKSRGYILPETPEGLVEALRIRGNNYLEKRLSSMLKHRSWKTLLKMDERCLDALVRGASDDEIGSVCFHLLRSKIDGWVLPFWPELGILDRNHLLEWWKPRKGKKLRELKIEAIKHAVEEAEKKNWEHEKNKMYVLRRLKNALEKKEPHPDIYTVTEDVEE